MLSIFQIISLFLGLFLTTVTADKSLPFTHYIPADSQQWRNPLVGFWPDASTTIWSRKKQQQKQFLPAKMGNWWQKTGCVPGPDYTQKLKWNLTLGVQWWKFHHLLMPSCLRVHVTCVDVSAAKSMTDRQYAPTSSNDCTCVELILVRRHPVVCGRGLEVSRLLIFTSCQVFHNSSRLVN